MGLRDGMAVRDLNEIRPGLYLGSQRAEQVGDYLIAQHKLPDTRLIRPPYQSPVSMLKEYNITHIVQVGTGHWMKPTHKDILEYCCIGVMDADHEPLLWHIRQSKALAFVDTARESGAVLVHCQMGMSRSATVVIAYLMWKEGLSFEAALSDVIKKRAVVAPNPGFCAQLMAFGDRFNSDIEAYSADIEPVSFNRDSQVPLDRGSQLRRDMAWLEMLERARCAGTPSVAKAAPAPAKQATENVATIADAV